MAAKQKKQQSNQREREANLGQQDAQREKDKESELSRMGETSADKRSDEGHSD
jgi:hypothetical protein